MNSAMNTPPPSMSNSTAGPLWTQSRPYPIGYSESTELSRWDLPALFMALEFSIYDWLTGRVGATKTVDTPEPQSGITFLQAVNFRASQGTERHHAFSTRFAVQSE